MGIRIALFIDGANLHHTAKSLGFEIDYKKLLVEFERHGVLLRAFFYTTISDSDFSGVRPLADWLAYNGFTVKIKPTKEFDDGEGRRKIKRNIGVELAIDALTTAAYVDQIYLFSGDGDLQPLVESLQRLSVRVAIVSSTLTAPPMVAGDLRRKADIFIELNSLRPLVERSRTFERASRRPK